MTSPGGESIAIWSRYKLGGHFYYGRTRIPTPGVRVYSNFIELGLPGGLFVGVCR